MHVLVKKQLMLFFCFYLNHMLNCSISFLSFNMLFWLQCVFVAFGFLIQYNWSSIEGIFLIAMCLLEAEGDELILTVYLCLPLGILCLPACLLKEVFVSKQSSINSFLGDRSCISEWEWRRALMVSGGITSIWLNTDTVPGSGNS